MKLTVEKIDISDMDYIRFVKEYLILEKPVVITGLNDYDKEKFGGLSLRRHLLLLYLSS